MASVINMNDGTTSVIEDVIQVPNSNNANSQMSGPWDDESLDISKRIELLSQEVERLETESILKMYAVRGGLEFGNEIKTFIEDKAKWRFTDALVLVSIHREIEAAIRECRESQEFQITGTLLEPLLYTLQTAEGIGFESARAFHENILNPISEAVNLQRKDAQHLNNMKLKLGSLENGIDPNSIEEESSEDSNA
jgi:hypothetical protein